MTITCPNPECRTAYTITPENQHRRKTCKRCGSVLQVGENGNAAEAGVAPAAVVVGMPPALPALAANPVGLPPMVKERLAVLQRLTDQATWFFAGGMFLVVIFNIFPQLDRAKVARREGHIIMGDVREKRLDEEYAKKEKPDADEVERRTKAKERWARDKSELEEDLENAELARRTWPYWYRWGMLFGLVLLAIGSLAYIRPSETPVRRILGAVVLAAIILSFVGGGVRIDLGG